MNSELYKDKYRIKSSRAEWWNYASDAFYFVTIITKGRFPYFGKCNNGINTLCRLGKEAEACWNLIPQHFPHAAVHDVVIMPNHIHGIIEIKAQGEGGRKSQDLFINSLIENNNNPRPNQLAPQSRNLASIIRGFKIGVTKYARMNNVEFNWQPRYHDRIIRDELEFYNVQNYIEQNPAKWTGDEFHFP